MTRAKALLIIVGNPRILCLDPSWKTLITFIKEHGGYKGSQFNMEDDVEIDDVIESLRKSSMLGKLFPTLPSTQFINF